jgi:sugar (pentulose or hexulose) kinase
LKLGATRYVQHSTAVVDPDDIRGLGFDAACSLVVVDETGAPVTVSPPGDDRRNVIVWMDHRAAAQAEDHCEVLRRFFDVVDPEDIEVVVGDRESISTEWLRWLRNREIPFVARLRSDRRIGLSPEGPSLPARMFTRPPAS